MKAMNVSEQVAAQVVKEVFECLDELCESVSVVRDNCDDETFEAYRLAVANAVSEVADTVLEPVYLAHAHLRP